MNPDEMRTLYVGQLEGVAKRTLVFLRDLIDLYRRSDLPIPEEICDLTNAYTKLESEWWTDWEGK